MAYNPAMYNTYGNMYAGSYAQGQYQQPAQQMQQPSYTQMQMPSGMTWVDGEVGAKAFQLPSGWPMNTPYPLWDTNDPIIYLKSTNQMGMPNPLQKLHYTMDEQPKRYSQSGGMAMQNPALMSGAEENPTEEYVKKQDLSQITDGYVKREDLNHITDGYVKKTDLDQMKKELMDSISQMQNGTQRRTAKGE